MNHPTVFASSDPHLDEHVCLDFLQGFLSTVERERVLRHIEQCPACEDLLRERAAERERFRATLRPVLRPNGKLVLERLGSARRDHPLSILWRRIRTSCTGSRRWPLLAPAAIAAVFLALLLRPDAPTPRIEPLPPYHFELQSRDPLVAGPDRNLQNGLAAYDRGDYATAIALLQEPELGNEGALVKVLREIFLGSALALQGEHAAAARVLEKVPYQFVPEEWGQEAHWTFYAALARSGQIARADSLLTVFAEKPGVLGERAREVMHR